MTMVRPVCAVLGAGPGMGLSIARRFAQGGYGVALVARRSESLARLSDELIESGFDARAFPADLSDETQLTACLQDIRSRMGKIEVLVYNAAVLRQALASRTTTSDYLDDFRTNVLGGITATQFVLPEMKSEKKGTILFTGGGLALNPLPDFSSLAIGKSAIRSYALSLSNELKAHGIHVATVTICGIVKKGTKFDPDAIAEEYWKLHQQPQADWEQELRFE